MQGDQCAGAGKGGGKACNLTGWGEFLGSVIYKLGYENGKLLAGEVEGGVGRKGVPGRWGNGRLSQG